MTSIAQVILIRHDGALLLSQDEHRVLPLSEPIEPPEAPRDAALRALLTQTNLDVDLDDLVFFRHYPGSGYYFLLPFVPSATLHLIAGQPAAIIHHHAAAQRLNLHPALRRAVTDYYHERRKAMSKRNRNTAAIRTNKSNDGL